MFDILSDGFKKATQKFQGKATLTEENVSSALTEIRRSLLEADVEYVSVAGAVDGLVCGDQPFFHRRKYGDHLEG